MNPIFTQTHTFTFVGGIFASLMPKEDYFSKALYTFDIGQNDLGEGFFGNMTIQEVNASVPDIITGFSTNIKVIISIYQPIP